MYQGFIMRVFRTVCFWATGLLLAGCSVEVVDKNAPAGGSGGGADTKQPEVAAPAPTGEKKRIQVNGSSTVEKISTAVAEKFEAQFSDVQIAIKAPGTGTGFKEMIAGRVDIANASRPIKDSEKAECEKQGIELLELKIALDGLSVCVSKENDWCDSITVADLKKIWEPGSTVKTWKDVNADWPAEEIHLFGAGEESGTFDYFTEAINGKEDAITENYSASSDDNVILTGISGDKYSMGFLGCAYYFLNRDKVKALKISPTATTAEAVELTPENVAAGTYKPLSRPLFIYVKRSALERQEMKDFVRFFLHEGQAQVAEVDYVPLSAEELAKSREIFDAAAK
jgi:phosphate transport system substrate-binding protein